MLVIDSGLGGISVVRALRATRPDMPLIYIADTAGFPYGKKTAEEIGARARRVIETVEESHSPGVVVLACNTLSTLCLGDLRKSFSVYPFVGTVPAIKVAAARSKSHSFTLLATPNTAQSAYTKDLIAEFAEGCSVHSYGAPNLAQYAEQMMLGNPIDSKLLKVELAPAFIEDTHGKTDAIVLGCTHYPLILDALRAAAPWEVDWIDSSEAIARRAFSFKDISPAKSSIAYVTKPEDVARYSDVFAREGFAHTKLLTIA